MNALLFVEGLAIGALLAHPGSANPTPSRPPVPWYDIGRNLSLADPHSNANEWWLHPPFSGGGFATVQPATAARVAGVECDSSVPNTEPTNRVSCAGTPSTHASPPPDTLSQQELGQMMQVPVPLDQIPGG